jgi:hypothetical protein
MLWAPSLFEIYYLIIHEMHKYNIYAVKGGICEFGAVFYILCALVVD